MLCFLYNNLQQYDLLRIRYQSLSSKCVMSVSIFVLINDPMPWEMCYPLLLSRSSLLLTKPCSRKSFLISLLSSWNSSHLEKCASKNSLLGCVQMKSQTFFYLPIRVTPHDLSNSTVEIKS